MNTLLYWKYFLEKAPLSQSDSLINIFLNSPVKSIQSLFIFVYEMFHEHVHFWKVPQTEEPGGL